VSSTPHNILYIRYVQDQTPGVDCSSARGRRQTWEDEKDDYAEERQFISNAKIVVSTACRASHWQ
jgi:hypothetical protein